MYMFSDRARVLPGDARGGGGRRWRFKRGYAIIIIIIIIETILIISFVYTGVTVSITKTPIC